MGESLVEARNIENKMGESVASRPTLEVSISFGKFENDSLSWEKWSTFSPNKYLEEVGKCSTPGSVAQKKAYFEAHYKKIAAKKLQLLDQEKLTETDPSRSDDQNCQDHTESSLEEIEQGTNLDSVASSTNVNVPRDEAAMKLEYGSSAVEELNEESNGIPDSKESGGLEEATSVKASSVEDESTLNGTQDMMDEPLQVDNASECQSSLESQSQETLIGKPNDNEFNNPEEAALAEIEKLDMSKQPSQVDNERGRTPESKDKILKLNAQNVSQKEHPSKKEQSLIGTKKKKPASPIPKSTKISTPRKPKETSASTPMSAPRTSVKKSSASPIPRSKNPSVRQNKPVTPTSLHLSLNLGSANSNSASPTTNRKSLIMEQMGDKDIVKRAFKTFQNNYNQVKSSNDGPSSGPKQLSTRVPEQRASTAMTTQKENERVRKVGQKINGQSGPSGTRWNSIASGPHHRGAGADERFVKAASSSVGLRSNERAESRKEFFKKLEEKSNAREAERTHLSEKSKEEKDAEIKMLRQGLNFKAKPMPGFYRVQGASKRPSEKEVAKNEIHQRPKSRW